MNGSKCIYIIGSFVELLIRNAGSTINLPGAQIMACSHFGPPLAQHTHVGPHMGEWWVGMGGLWNVCWCHKVPRPSWAASRAHMCNHTKDPHGLFVSNKGRARHVRLPGNQWWLREVTMLMLFHKMSNYSFNLGSSLGHGGLKGGSLLMSQLF